MKASIIGTLLGSLILGAPAIDTNAALIPARQQVQPIDLERRLVEDDGMDWGDFTDLRAPASLEPAIEFFKQFYIGSKDAIFYNRATFEIYEEKEVTKTPGFMISNAQWQNLKNERNRLEAGLVKEGKIKPGQLEWTIGMGDIFKHNIPEISRYMNPMKRVFAEGNISPEMAYLAIVESGGKLYARSPAGAQGILQFMFYTGRQFHRIESAVNESWDPIVAARSCRTYLKALYAMFGIEEIAIGAYNTGEGSYYKATTFGRAIVGTADDTRLLETILTEFSKAKEIGEIFPRESREYLVRLLGVQRGIREYYPKNIFDDELEYDSISLEYPKEKKDLKGNIKLTDKVNIRDVIKKMSLNEKEMRLLNPSFRYLLGQKNYLTERLPEGVELRVPAGRGDELLRLVSTYLTPQATMNKARKGAPVEMNNCFTEADAVYRGYIRDRRNGLEVGVEKLEALRIQYEYELATQVGDPNMRKHIESQLSALKYDFARERGMQSTGWKAYAQKFDRKLAAYLQIHRLINQTIIKPVPATIGYEKNH